MMKSTNRAAMLLAFSLSLLVIGGCADDPASAANGPGIENSAAASTNSIVPAVGTAGNGGGISGGAGGAAVSH